MAEAYTDVKLIETTELTPEGQLLKVWRVSARSKGGVRFTVSIPDAQMEAGKAAQILAKKAQTLDAIAAL